jgi:hypothetical protein
VSGCRAHERLVGLHGLPRSPENHAICSVARRLRRVVNQTSVFRGDCVMRSEDA